MVVSKFYCVLVNRVFKWFHPETFTFYNIWSCFNICKSLLYADDLKIFATVDNVADYMLFQNNLNTPYIYCKKYLFLNLNKCGPVTFTRNLKHSPTIMISMVLFWMWFITLKIWALCLIVKCCLIYTGTA